LRAILLAQTLTGRISSKNRTHWREWMRQHAAHSVDCAVEQGDRIPGIVHGLSEIYLGLKSFPRFMRSTPRVSPLLQDLLRKGQL
jgi:D-aspartate ligase